MNARLLIVDDHPIFRRGIVAALSETGDYGELVEAGSLAEAESLLALSDFGLVIADLGLTDGSGFDLLESRARKPGAPRFFVLSMSADQASARRALTLGASGYASKNIDLSTLSLGLKLVMAGEIFVESEILRDVLNLSMNRAARQEEARAAIAALGRREREALDAILSGCGTKEMASRLGISQRTAENYQSALYSRLCVTSPLALLRLASEAGLI